MYSYIASDSVCGMYHSADVVQLHNILQCLWHVPLSGRYCVSGENVACGCCCRCNDEAVHQKFRQTCSAALVQYDADNKCLVVLVSMCIRALIDYWSVLVSMCIRALTNYWSVCVSGP